VSSKNLLLIFTRNPELGKCKTRLAATVGDQTALEIYLFLLQHTVHITKNLKVAKAVYYSETIWQDDIWDATIYQKRLQSNGDLGVKMAHAFQEGFEAGYEKIIVMGSDMYDLSEGDIENAFSQLTQTDFVIGPAEDGGYYLLGMKTLEPSVFKDKKWGTETVLKDTLNDLKNKNITLLDSRNDVDYYEDIANISAFKPFLKKYKND
tara:strand:+ start:110300 stop:110920 length:621 start_codon:yes stop_codon:yes gene_type:complete